MDIKRKNDVLEQTLSRLINFISSAESKIAPLFVISTSMLAIFMALVPSASDWKKKSVILVIFTVTPLIISLLLILVSIFPRTKGPKGSMIYFKGIIDQESDEYLNEMKEETEEKYFEDLSRQCYINAEIASRKFKLIRYSMISLFISVIPWLFIIYELYKAKD